MVSRIKYKVRKEVNKIKRKSGKRMLFKSVSMRKPGGAREEVIQLKSPISLKLGINVGFGE